MTKPHVWQDRNYTILGETTSTVMPLTLDDMTNVLRQAGLMDEREVVAGVALHPDTDRLQVQLQYRRSR